MEVKEISVLEQLEQKLEVQDPIKFFEHVKVLDATTTQIMPYQMWPHLEYLIKAIYKWPLVIVLKSKQIGFSWTVGGIAVHRCRRTGANIIEISKGEDQAADLLTKSRFIEDNLPKYLQQERDKDGTFLIHFKNRHSRIHTVPSTVTAGLGETASLVIPDEHEFHPYAKENWGHLKPTIDAGAPCIMGSTSDPTNIDSNFKVLWRGAREGMGDYYPIEGVNLKVNAGEIPGPNGFFPIFIGYDCRPGRDEEWYETTRKTYDLDWQFRANYPRTEEEALSPILGRTVFDAATLQKMQQNAIKEEEIRQGVVHIFRRPKVGTQYIAGVDMAEGRGGDYSVCWIEGKDGLGRELVAVIHSNHVLPDTFSFMSYELLKEYYNPRVIGGADAFGTRFLEDLVVHGYDRGKIYCSDPKREKLGFIESGKTRDKDLVEMERSIRGNMQIHYIPAIKEFFAFQFAENGRMEAATGSHDDLVMAACRANFGFTQYKTANQGISISYPNSWRGNNEKYRRY
jgi:hypothetical protein